MSEHSADFLGQYRSWYGRAYAKKMPDYGRCAASVLGDSHTGSSQCTRKNGHGPHGAWCKQHDPEAVKARRDASSDAFRAKWDAEARQSRFAAECRDAISAIAQGHDDPRGLAQSIIDRLGGAK